MSSVVDLKTKEEKDAELDRRIEALRKKNEALVKRYQEIEEDKKKAEQEGIAVTTPRKPRPEQENDRRKIEKENFTVTVDLSKPAGEKRVVNDWKPSMPRGWKTSEEGEGLSPSRRMGSGRLGRGGQRGGGGGRQEKREWDRLDRPARDGEPDDGGRQGRRGGRRGRGEAAAARGGGAAAAGGGGAGAPGGGAGGAGGAGGGTPAGIDRKSKEWEEKRRQNIEKMNEEMERIAEYERGQRPDGDKPIRNFLDDPRRSGPVPDIDRKEGSRRHVRNWGGLDFDNVKTGAELEKEWTSRRTGPKGSMDMIMTGRERAEYLRWKKEREQIDEERLARHRNATGQWRREWDAQKTENMFTEDPYVSPEGTTPEQGGRRARGRNSRTEPRGRASDDGKRPPKAPMFGDFLSQGRSRGDRGDRSRGKGRGQKPSYSMHDNRWEGEKEDEEKENEYRSKKEEKTEKKAEEKPKAPPPEKVEEKNVDGEDDEDEWEDASDGEDDNDAMDEGSDKGEDGAKGSEKKDAAREKPTRTKDNSPTSPTPRSPRASAGSPKGQRTPRPKIHIPSPAQDSSEGGKPISPFSPLDGHQPVSDWGEEMEMQSPRSSMVGESPLKPPSTEASPPQNKTPDKDQDEAENLATSHSEPAESEKDAGCTPTDSSSVPPSEGPDSVPADVSAPAPSEVSEAAVRSDEETPATPPQDKPDAAPSPLILEADQSFSDPAGGESAGTEALPVAPASPSEQPSSG